MNLPKLWERRREFKVTTKTLKAGLMGQAFAQQMQIFLKIRILRSANVDPLSLATFLTTDIDMHSPPRSGHESTGFYLPTTIVP